MTHRRRAEETHCTGAGDGAWLTTMAGRKALCSSSFCFRALYMASVSTATNLFTCKSNYNLSSNPEIQSKKPEEGTQTWLSMPMSEGVVRWTTVRWHRRRRMASRVPRWSLRVPGRPRTSVMYSLGLHWIGTQALKALNALPAILTLLRSSARRSLKP